MANGNGTETRPRTAERMKRAATDLAVGNPLDRICFQIGWLCGELDKRDAAIDELRGEVARLKEATADDGR